MRWVSEFRERVSALLFRERNAAELDEEIRFHLDRETERLVRVEGLDAREARRRARIAFGGVERTKEEVRVAQGVGWLTGWWLDVKLGLRMLVKHPGLTLVGVFGMAVAIAIGAITYQGVSNLLNATLPVPGGERVVSLGFWNAESSGPERRILHDFEIWREGLESLEAVGAFRDISVNLIVGKDGVAEPVDVAEVTASSFRVLGTPPLLGRTLVREDERDGPPVAVIGHELWRQRFDAAPSTIGRTVRLDGVVHTVVGVMPEGFGFPVDHQVWVPLREAPSEYGPLEGPRVQVFGRLAPGVPLERVRAEMATVAERSATRSPEAYAPLRPRVLPYTHDQVMDVETSPLGWVAWVGQLVVSLLLVVVAVNVGVLSYARTVARGGEIAVRTALGASRRRVVAQLFVEALLLSGIAAVIGLAVAQVALSRISVAIASLERMPFWIDLDLSAETVLYAFGMAVVAAVIVGVLPGLKATAGRPQSKLREAGGGALELSRTWSLLIIVQVAIAVLFLPLAMMIVWETRPRGDDLGIPAEQVLIARLSAQERERTARQLELATRLQAEPAVAAVTFSSHLPGVGPTGEVEMAPEGRAADPQAAVDQDVLYFRVALAFFEAFDARILAGRRFDAGDFGDGVTPVIVNRAFTERVLGGGSAVGRQLRYTRTQSNFPIAEEEGTWYEIVGVVEDFPAYSLLLSGTSQAAVYHPVAVAALPRPMLSLRLETPDVQAFTRRLREVATQVDPTLQLDEVQSLSDYYEAERFSIVLLSGTFALITLSVLLLSGAGIYALTSFSVAQRTREIGIRSALGGQPRRILGSIFRRALWQLSMGSGIGLLLGGALVALGTDLRPEESAIMVAATALIIMAVGLFAVLGPARRGLQVAPTEALRAE